MLTEGQRLGAYRIVRLLGEGGMGAVYEARQEPLDRRVALKTLHADHAKNKESIARFFNEAKVLSRLEHPSIVQVSDFGHATDGTAYLVMEYLRGQSLGRRIRERSERGERVPLEVTLHVCVQVADVLALAHTQGIVHRDIKPENLMLVADPVAPGGERVKVLDFGIAKLSDDRGGVKTATNQMMGTPAYMSPEQCAGAGKVDGQTDVYALGCVLYELLSGQTLFVAEGPGHMIAMHLFQEPPSLSSVAPHVPADITALVHRMLRKEKSQRPSMSEVASDLAKLLSKQTGGRISVRPLASIETAGTADGSAQAPLAQASTIGRSVGQVGRFPAQMRRGLLLSGGAGVLSIGLVALVWIGHRTESKLTPVSASTAPLAEKSSISDAEHPDLGNERGKSDGALSTGLAKQQEVASPTKSKAPPVTKPSTRVSPSRPSSKTLSKKRFGYEE